MEVLLILLIILVSAIDKPFVIFGGYIAISPATDNGELAVIVPIPTLAGVVVVVFPIYKELTPLFALNE